MSKRNKYPSYTQLTRPLLDLFEAHGGSAKPGDIYGFNIAHAFMPVMAVPSKGT